MTAVKTADRVVVSVTATDSGAWQVVSIPTGFQGIVSTLFAENDYLHGFVRHEDGEQWEVYDFDGGDATKLLQITSISGTVTLARPATPWDSSKSDGSRMDAGTGTHTLTLSEGAGTLSRIFRELSPFWKTFTSADSSPSVADYRFFKTQGTTAITRFDDLTNGQRFLVRRGSADIVIQHDGTNIDLFGGANVTLTAASPAIEFVVEAGVAKQIAGFVLPLDEDDFASDSATRPPSQQSAKAYIASQILDEDDFVTNSATKAPSQQSSKAYIDGKIVDEDDFASDTATKAPSQQSTKAYIGAQAFVKSVAAISDLQALSLALAPAGSAVEVKDTRRGGTFVRTSTVALWGAPVITERGNGWASGYYEGIPIAGGDGTARANVRVIDMGIAELQVQGDKRGSGFSGDATISGTVSVTALSGSASIGATSFSVSSATGAVIGGHAVILQDNNDYVVSQITNVVGTTITIRDALWYAAASSNAVVFSLIPVDPDFYANGTSRTAFDITFPRFNGGTVFSASGGGAWVRQFEGPALATWWPNVIPWDKTQDIAPGVNEAMRVYDHVHIPAGCYGLQTSVILPSGVSLTGDGPGNCGNNWGYIPDLHGTILFAFGTGPRTQKMCGATDMRYAGGVLKNSVRYDSNDAEFSLTSFYNNDAFHKVTTLSSTVSSGTSISIASATGVAIGQYATVTLNSGKLRTTVTGVSGTTITLADAIPSTATSGNSVGFYKPATQRGFSAAVKSSFGAQGGSIEGIRVQLAYGSDFSNYGLFGNYDDFAWLPGNVSVGIARPTGLGTGSWDVGIMVDNTRAFTIKDCATIGYFRMYGLLQACVGGSNDRVDIYLRPGATAQLNYNEFMSRRAHGAEQLRVYGGCFRGQVGFGSRGGDQVRVLAADSTTITLPYANTCPVDPSLTGPMRGYIRAGSNGAFNHVEAALDADGDPVIVISGLTVAGNTGGYGSGSNCIMIRQSVGNAATILQGVSLIGMEHASGNRITEANGVTASEMGPVGVNFGLRPSAVAELAGWPLNDVHFNETYTSGVDDVYLHAHAHGAIYFNDCICENQVTQIGRDQGYKVIAQPNLASAIFGCKYPTNNGVSRLDWRGRYLFLDMAPQSFKPWQTAVTTIPSAAQVPPRWSASAIHNRVMDQTSGTDGTLTIASASDAGVNPKYTITHSAQDMTSYANGWGLTAGMRFRLWNTGGNNDRILCYIESIDGTGKILTVRASSALTTGTLTTYNLSAYTGLLDPEAGAYTDDTIQSLNTSGATTVQSTGNRGNGNVVSESTGAGTQPYFTGLRKLAGTGDVITTFSGRAGYNNANAYADHEVVRLHFKLKDAASGGTGQVSLQALNAGSMQTIFDAYDTSTDIYGGGSMAVSFTASLAIYYHNVQIGVSGGGTAYQVITAAAGNARTTRYQTDLSNRWQAGANSTAEGGSDAGSDYFVGAYTDAGSFIGNGLSIKRSTLEVGLGGTFQSGYGAYIYGQATATLGFVIPSYTAAQIASAAHAVNTTGKKVGLVVRDSTNTRLMVSNGTGATSTWSVCDGSATVTPA